MHVGNLSSFFRVVLRVVQALMSSTRIELSWLGPRLPAEDGQAMFLSCYGASCGADDLRSA